MITAPQSAMLALMAGTSITITLPEPLKHFVDSQVESGTYGTPNDYVRDLIREDRDRILRKLEDRLIENLKSELVEFSDEELDSPHFVDVCRRKLRETA